MADPPSSERFREHASRGAASVHWRRAAATGLCLLSLGCGRLGFELFSAETEPDHDGGADFAAGGEAGSVPAGSGGVPAEEAGAGGGGTGGSQDGGAGQGGTASAGVDGGHMDGGHMDAGLADPAILDAGIFDAGRADAGLADGQVAAPDGGDTCDLDPQPIDDLCVELPELPNAPVIDGELDCGLQLRPLVAVAWTADGSPDATAEHVVAWRPDGLYFYLHVLDASLIPAAPGDHLWWGDGVEIYVDDDSLHQAPPFYDDPGGRQFIIAAPADASTTTARGQVWSYDNPGFPHAWDSTRFAAYPKLGGYAVEAFVTAEDLGLETWSLTAGQRVGLNLSINVSYPDPETIGEAGHRHGQYFLYVAPELDPPYPYHNAEAFCDPVLVAR